VLSVALTGNIASGKSTVARLFERWGARLIDADAIVRELQQPGTPVFQQIVERFGPAVLAPDGTLDRVSLRSLVFRDDRARDGLNAIVHPAVRARRDSLMAEARASRVPVVVQDIPLLFEALDPTAFDLVVLVDAPVDIRRARLMEHRHLDREEADRMIAAQLPAAAKRSRSHLVIDNDADLVTLETRARAAWEEISRIAAHRA
jgi:dephospho-CoA kinase